MKGFSKSNNKTKPNPFQTDEEFEDVFLDEGIITYAENNSVLYSMADSSVFPSLSAVSSISASEMEKGSDSSGTGSTGSNSPIPEGAAASFPPPPPARRKKRKQRKPTKYQQRCTRILLVSFLIAAMFVLGVGAILYYWLYQEGGTTIFSLGGESDDSTDSANKEAPPDYEWFTLAPSDKEVDPTARPTPGPTSLPSLSPTPAPTRPPAPTRSPTVMQGIAARHYLIQDHGVEFPDDPEAPPNKAIRLMAKTSAQSGIDLVFDDFLLQRFVMVTISLTLRKPIIDQDDYGDTNQTIVLDTYGDLEAHECEWTGVICVNNTVTQLTLGNQYMEGQIPGEIGYLSDLKYLDLARNQITGIIPDGLYELKKLEELYLYQNKLTGKLSTRVGRLRRLTHLHLSHNRLSGKLPLSLNSTGTSKRYRKSLYTLH